MKVGDIIDYEGARWFVSRINREARVAVLFGRDGLRREVPDTMDVDFDEFKVVANPASEWRLLVIPVRSNAQGIESLRLLPDANRKTPVELQPWVDWIGSDPFRPGGSLLFRADGPVRSGDVLLVTFRNHSTARVNVPRTFGTLEERRSRAVPVTVPRESSRYDRIILDDD